MGCGQPFQIVGRLGLRQASECAGGNGRIRIGMRVDSGRKVDPRFRRVWKHQARSAEIAAVADRSLCHF